MIRRNDVLPDTCLTAIIRDEKMNPAGGVERFLKSTIPHVERAVVVDTGSVDGTREILDTLEKEFSQLAVYDHPFNGYADARNESLTHVQTRRALVLDADELMTRKGFEELAETLQKNPLAFFYMFNFVKMAPNENFQRAVTGIHASRLFDAKKVKFEGYLWEVARVDGPKREDSYEDYRYYMALPIIYHFMPSPKGTREKRTHWYESLEASPSRSPSKTKNVALWKAFNSKRNLKQFN